MMPPPWPDPLKSPEPQNKAPWWARLIALIGAIVALVALMFLCGNPPK